MKHKDILKARGLPLTGFGKNPEVYYSFIPGDIVRFTSCLDDREFDLHCIQSRYSDYGGPVRGEQPRTGWQVQFPENRVKEAAGVVAYMVQKQLLAPCSLNLATKVLRQFCLNLRIHGIHTQ